MEKPEGYPEANPREDNQSLWFTSEPENDMSFELNDHDYYFYSFDESKFGKLSDNPKLFAVVEFLREVFVRRKEILPRLLDQVNEGLKKSGLRLWRVKSGNKDRTMVGTVNRSLSLGSGREKYCDDNTMVNEWIKIKTINTTTTTTTGDQAGGGSSGS